MKKTSTKKFDIYEEVTKRITEELEKGVIPWQKPWKTKATGEMFPCFSYSTGKRYDFINIMLLGGEPGEFATFNQITKEGGKVKKGAKSRFIVGWVVTDHQRKDADGKPLVDEDGKPETYKTFGLRYYSVFNILTDVEGLQPKKNWTEDEGEENAVDPVESAEKILHGYIDRPDAPKFEEKASNKAYYQPGLDLVVVPDKRQYEYIEEYYSTAFHELTHSTMKESRCNREEDRKGKKCAFGSEVYSKEELVAEIGAASLVMIAGIETEHSFRNSAAYIQSWLKALKDDVTMLVYASSQAQKAVEYILGE